MSFKNHKTLSSVKQLVKRFIVLNVDSFSMKSYTTHFLESTF